MFKKVAIFVVALVFVLFLVALTQHSAPVPKVLAESAAPQTGAALEALAATLAASGKFHDAGDTCDRAGKAYTAEGNSDAAALAFGKAAGFYEKEADAILKAPNDPATALLNDPATALPKAPQAAAITVPLRLPSLSPKPGFIRGRAVYEDGRPIADFSAYAAGVAGSGRANGKNGYYEVAMTPGLLISEVSAQATIPYRNKLWSMTLHPLDGLGNGYEANKFRGNTTPGIVRDFVLKMTGTAPAFPAGEDADYSVNDQGHSYRYGGWLYVGCTYGKDGINDTATGLFMVYPKASKITLTLTPTAPRLDGSTGTTLVREFPIAQVMNLYGIPVGVYNATAEMHEPNGTRHTLRMCLEMPSQASDWKPSALLEWKPRDIQFGGINPCSLYFVE